jgi:hypothetical protein
LGSKKDLLGWEMKRKGTGRVEKGSENQERKVDERYSSKLLSI